MKRLAVLVVLYSLVLVFSLSTYAENFSSSQKSSIVKSLVNGLKSDNLGLRSSAAETISSFIDENILHKNDFKETLLPLMKMLRDGQSEEEKIAAAISLYKLEDPRGIYQLKGAAKYSDSEKVREITRDLYIRFHQLNNISYTADF